MTFRILLTSVIVAMLTVVSCGISNAATSPAKGYELDIQLSVKGKKINIPKMTIPEGETTFISQTQGGEKYFLQVRANKSKTGNDAVNMKFQIGKILKNKKIEIIGKPEISTKNTLTAEIQSANSKTKAEEFTLSVTPKATKLQ